MKRKIKALLRANWSSKDKANNSSLEMLSYKSTDIILANLRIALSFFEKQIFLKFIANISFRLEELTVYLATSSKTNCACC